MVRKNKTFLDWMLYIKSNYYASPVTIDIANAQNNCKTNTILLYCSKQKNELL